MILFMTKKVPLFLSLAMVASLFPVGLTAEVSKKDAEYLEMFGWATGSQASLSRLGLSDDEMVYFIKGLKSSAQGESPPTKDYEIYNQMNDFLMVKAEAYAKIEDKKNESIAKKNKADAMSFYKELEKNPKVKKTDTGLYYEIIEVGEGPMPTANSDVTVHYEGTLIDGEVFDSSKSRGHPATFNLQHVIPGFRDGLQLVGKGGKIKLYVPPELGYGNQALPGIPAGSTLIFDVDMIDFKG
ncbi:MAG: hypothetical protein AUJ82_07785 [Verrucomicrobia bacterium CG1_02_43_26]|nr:MAG: hypothetical protein AUJ82_07785 [Verrucomicrobia bacterium CG1_02_43_26]